MKNIKQKEKNKNKDKNKDNKKESLDNLSFSCDCSQCPRACK